MIALMKIRTLLVTGGLDGALAVGLGAFGAHGLRERLEVAGMADVWQTAVQYQSLHALALLLLGALAAAGLGGRALRAAAWLWIVGTFLFSGSLYALALEAPRFLGPITPIGGICLIAGWVTLCWLRPAESVPKSSR
jgi:uncharacterized membrane protein YgdD (TMEM256/DUF423 family)